jgi:hypothetical protein
VNGDNHAAPQNGLAISSSLVKLDSSTKKTTPEPWVSIKSIFGSPPVPDNADIVVRIAGRFQRIDRGVVVSRCTINGNNVPVAHRIRPILRPAFSVLLMPRS